MQNIWQILIAQLAISVAAVALWTPARDRLTDRVLLRDSIFGCVMGLAAVVMMVIAAPARPSPLLDLRSTPIAMAGLFGGPAGALAATAVTLMAQVWYGGADLAGGCFAACFAGLVGLLGNRLVPGGAVRRTDLVGLGLVLASCSLVAIVVERPSDPTTLVAIGLPMAAMILVSTLVVGFTILRDTERMHRQDSLASMKRLLEESIENMADGLVMYDSQCVVLLCNQKHRDLFPLTADLRVPGARLPDFLRAAVRRGEEVIEEREIEPWISHICADLRIPGERMFRLKDGRHIECRTRPLSNGGSLQLMSDVTERVRADQALKQANDQLAFLARTDGLTGLMNRRGFDQSLDMEFARSVRDGLPLSLLMIDVDRFKRFNDSYGHPEGDACLRRLGQAIAGTLRRPADMAARYGGEEFAVVLPDTPPLGALEIAEAIRSAVRDLKIKHSGSAIGIVTVSVGISTLSRPLGLARCQDLIDRADHALYTAKAEGRDRVCVGTPVLSDA